MILHESPERRIDITLHSVRETYNALSLEERAALSQRPWISTLETVFAIRAMERGEEEALGRPSVGLADIYDRIVTPGENAAEALLRTFREMFAVAETDAVAPGDTGLVSGATSAPPPPVESN